MWVTGSILVKLNPNTNSLASVLVSAPEWFSRVFDIRWLSDPSQHAGLCPGEDRTWQHGRLDHSVWFGSTSPKSPYSNLRQSWRPVNWDCVSGECVRLARPIGKNVSAQPRTLATGHTLTDGHGTHGLPFGPYLTLPSSVPCLIIIPSSPYQIPQSLVPS